MVVVVAEYCQYLIRYIVLTNEAIEAEEEVIAR